MTLYKYLIQNYVLDINVYQVLKATNNHYMIHTELSSNSTLKCLGTMFC